METYLLIILVLGGPIAIIMLIAAAMGMNFVGSYAGPFKYFFKIDAIYIVVVVVMAVILGIVALLGA